MNGEITVVDILVIVFFLILIAIVIYLSKICSLTKKMLEINTSTSQRLLNLTHEIKRGLGEINDDFMLSNAKITKLSTILENIKSEIENIRMVRADEHDVIYQCVRCGKNVDADASVCPFCGCIFDTEPAGKT